MVTVQKKHIGFTQRDNFFYLMNLSESGVGTNSSSKFQLPFDWKAGVTKGEEN
jgi:hypothetical protein